MLSHRKTSCPPSDAKVHNLKGIVTREGYFNETHNSKIFRTNIHLHRFSLHCIRMNILNNFPEKTKNGRTEKIIKGNFKLELSGLGVDVILSLIIMI
jgi:hypothetical protein